MPESQRLLRMWWVSALTAVVLLSLTSKGQGQQPASPSAAGSTAVPPVTAPKAPATFLFVHWERFSRKDSKQRAMQQIVDETQESLRSRGVRFVSDPLRKTSHSKELFSLTTLLSVAKDAEASHLLYLNIFVGARLQCFDLSGRMVWEEAVKGAIAANALEHNTRVVMKRLEKQLEPRMGTECLQVAGAQGAAASQAHAQRPN